MGGWTDEPISLDSGDPLWARVGGGLEEVTSARRHGPADPGFPPPAGPWEELWANSRLVGWARAGGPTRSLVRRALEEGERIARDRRSLLLSRLGHKLRSSVLALQESTRIAAFSREGTLERIHELARDVGVRATALETVALDPKDPPRDLLIGAVLKLAALNADPLLPGDGVVRASESLLVDALKRTCQWMGGSQCTVSGEMIGGWWRLEMVAAPVRKPLPVPEMGEQLVRHLVDGCLEGWLDSSADDRAVIYLPAGHH